MKNKVNAIVKNAADGLAYRVIDETADVVVLAPVREAVDENGDVSYEAINAPAVKMPQKVFDVLCGEVIVEAPPAELSAGDVVVSNGRMEICGNPVECGTLYVNKVAAVVPGGVIVEVRSKDGTGIDLKFYDVDEDRFVRMTSDKDAADLVYQDGKVTAFIVEKKTDVKIPVNNDDDEDEDEDGDTYECAVAIDRSLRFYKNGQGIKMIDGVFGDLVDTRKEGTSDVMLFATDNGYRDVYDTSGYPVTIADDAIAGEDTRTVKVVVSHDENGDAWVEEPAYRVFHGRILDTMYGVDGNYVFITDCDAIVNMNTEKGRFYRTACGKDVVDAVRRYPVPVGIDVPVPTKTVFTFTTEDMTSICTITVDKTRDRGYVTKIEEI